MFAVSNIISVWVQFRSIPKPSYLNKNSVKLDMIMVWLRDQVDYYIVSVQFGSTRNSIRIDARMVIVHDPVN